MTLSKRPRGTRSSPGLPTPLFAARRPKSRHAASADGAAPAPERAPEQRHELIGTLARNVTARMRDHTLALETRAQLSSRCAEFFAEYDVPLCPITPTTAIPHDVAGRIAELTGGFVPPPGY